MLVVGVDCLVFLDIWSKYNELLLAWWDQGPQVRKGICVRFIWNWKFQFRCAHLMYIPVLQ